MGKDKKHKIEAKIRHNLMDWEEAPIDLKKKWKRHNFHHGEGKAKLKELKGKYIS